MRSFLGRAAPALLAVLLLFVALALLQRPHLPAVSAEHGDFAANGLLVLEAKRFALATGNYSRVGFNHPGPALIAVLAFGEALFHDALGLAKSPVAGQLLGVLLYTAAWLVAIAVLLRRWLGGWLPGIAATALFLALSARLDHNLLTAAWFPMLYFLPFAAFVLAAGRLALGRGDSLLVLATSLGVLVHGHAAFAPLCGLTLVLLLAAHLLGVRLGLAEARVLSPGFVRAHRRALLGVLAIGVLFALPILVETLRRWPGPVGDYLAYDRGGGRNALGDAFAFVAAYWARPRLLGPVLAVAALGAMLGLGALARGRAVSPAGIARARNALFLLATALAASLAVFAYAVFGVDQLSEFYVGIFYTAVPVVLVAWGATALAGMLPAWLQRGALVVVTVLALLLAPAPLRYPPGNAGDYLRPGLAEADAALRRAQPWPLVLDLDASADWGAVWTGVVGLQLHAARLGESQRYCIGAGWHILFTRAAACTPAQRAQGRVLRVSAAPPAPGAPPPLATLGPVRFEDER